MTERILMVDDDVNVLDGIKRQLRGQFTLETTSSSKDGLHMLTLEGPFAVVVADFRMPEMNGVQFLKSAKEISPNTVRIMLTGYAELGSVIDAINDGYIFRFLVKPCHPDTLVQAIYAALEQHRLIEAERELLEKTLARSIRLFTEILSKVNPVAFGQTLRIQKVVKRIVSNLGPINTWQFELAAMLSQIGCMTLPSIVLEKARSRTSLSDDEKNLFASHPMIAYRLLEEIPRIEPIPIMIRDQQKPFSAFSEIRENIGQQRAALGAQILKIAVDYENMTHDGVSHQDVVQTLLLHNQVYNPELVNALGNENILDDDWRVKHIYVSQATEGMVANENIISEDGSLVIPRGQVFTSTLIERLKYLAKEGNVVEPFSVLVPSILESNPPHHR